MPRLRALPLFVTLAGAFLSSACGAAATGKTVHVQMVGDAQGYRFEPADVTVHAGDAVEWANVSGGPHDVASWADSIPAGARRRSSRPTCPTPPRRSAGPLLTDQNATHVTSSAGLKPGVYHYYCTPHLALGTKAALTVQ